MKDEWLARSWHEAGHVLAMSAMGLPCWASMAGEVGRFGPRITDPYWQAVTFAAGAAACGLVGVTDDGEDLAGPDREVVARAGDRSQEAIDTAVGLVAYYMAEVAYIARLLRERGELSEDEIAAWWAEVAQAGSPEPRPPTVPPGTTGPPASRGTADRGKACHAVAAIDSAWW
jgi:hypothetical protein